MAAKHTPTLGAWAMASAIVAQGGLLAWMDLVTDREALRLGLVTVVLAAAVFELWRNRLRIDHHVDMLLVMLAFGGLGMVIGTNIDRALAPPAMAGHGGMHAAGLSWSGFFGSVWSWMNGLMLVGGIVPGIWMTRCASLARESWRRWVAVHLAGNVGMVVGMILAGKLLGHAMGMAMGLMATGHQLAMVLGMLAGMTVAQFAAEAALGLAPWRRIAVPLPQRRRRPAVSNN